MSSTFAARIVPTDSPSKGYATGQRDFRNANLRGLSFKNHDLSGAGFSSAAIAPTKKAILTNAFTQDGKEAIEAFLDPPYLNVAIRIIKEWKNSVS